jgi:RimJ/RimL family protein N-acetyltransferase
VRTIIATPRLRLREFTIRDLDFVATLLGDEEVMRFYPKTYNRAESQEWLDRQLRRYAADGHGLWLVALAGDRSPVGTVGLAMQTVDGVREPEIGWLIHRPCWRRGFAAEAALAVRGFAFAQLDKHRVISMIRPENLPSQGVAHRIGMAPERATMFHGYEHLVFAVSRIDSRGQSAIGVQSQGAGSTGEQPGVTA